MKDLLGRKEALSVKDAKDIILSQPFREPSVEEIYIDEAFGRVLAEDIFSPEDLPGFNRSTVDGYALKAEDTYGASENLPVLLELVGEVFMGHVPEFSINSGQCAYVPTGGMLPEGTDAVVMIEDTAALDERTVEIYRAISVWENVIRANDDIKKGELILPSGHKLRPQDVAALAGVGITNIRVYRKPVVALISTGDEIVHPDARKQKAQVRDVNSYTLSGLVLAEGGVPLRFGIIKDIKDELKKAVTEALKVADIVLISGGSSVGTKDYAEDVIEEMGEPGVLFHGVQMKPGKPLLAGRVRDRFIFGLPGHPVAVGICFEEFVRPVLRRLSGLREVPGVPDRRSVSAKLRSNIPSRFGRQEYVRVRLLFDGNNLWAEPVFGKSGLIKSLVRANGFVIVPKESNGIYEGQQVEVILFE